MVPKFGYVKRRRPSNAFGELMILFSRSGFVDTCFYLPEGCSWSNNWNLLPGNSFLTALNLVKGAVKTSWTWINPKMLITNKPFNIKWRIIKQCRPYSNVNNKCNLCLFEEFIIICRKNLCSLNKRNELASSWPPQKQIPTQEFFIK